MPKQNPYKQLEFTDEVKAFLAGNGPQPKGTRLLLKVDGVALDQERFPNAGVVLAMPSYAQDIEETLSYRGHFDTDFEFAYDTQTLEPLWVSDSYYNVGLFKGSEAHYEEVQREAHAHVADFRSAIGSKLEEHTRNMDLEAAYAAVEDESRYAFPQRKDLLREFITTGEMEQSLYSFEYDGQLSKMDLFEAAIGVEAAAERKADAMIHPATTGTSRDVWAVRRVYLQRWDELVEKEGPSVIAEGLPLRKLHEALENMNAKTVKLVFEGESGPIELTCDKERLQWEAGHGARPFTISEYHIKGAVPDELRVVLRGGGETRPDGTITPEWSRLSSELDMAKLLGVKSRGQLVWDATETWPKVDPKESLYANLLYNEVPLSMIHGHATDLYLEKNDLTEKVVEAWFAGQDFGFDALGSLFTDQVSGKQSYDIPLMYEPGWERRGQEVHDSTLAALQRAGMAPKADAKEAPDQNFDNPFAKSANAPGVAATPAQQERAKAAAKAQGKVLPGYQRMRGMGRDA